MKKTSVISIIGRPNAGKSTLLNEMLGQKISIVTPKVQTTRSSIKGIYTKNNTQQVFIDTPGIFSANKRLEKAMVRCAWTSIVGTDIICIIIDLSKRDIIDEEFEKILLHISKLDTKKVFVFNKIDKLDLNFPKEVLDTKNINRELFQNFAPEKADKFLDILKKFDNSNCIFISALKNRNINNLLDFLEAISPEGNWLYDENEITTAPLKFLCSEITREKLFFSLSDEIPYNLTVETEKWDQISETEVKIYQTIIVNRDSHKMIVLGKNGANIKMVGMKSRKEIEKLYEMRVHLFLFVKVRENWDSKAEYYNNMGLDLPKN